MSHDVHFFIYCRQVNVLVKTLKRTLNVSVKTFKRKNTFENEAIYKTSKINLVPTHSIR